MSRITTLSIGIPFAIQETQCSNARFIAARQACASAMTLSGQESKGMESYWTREVEDGVTCSKPTPAPPVCVFLCAEPSNCTKHPCYFCGSSSSRIVFAGMLSVACKRKCVAPQWHKKGTRHAVAVGKGAFGVVREVTSDGGHAQQRWQWYLL